nr:MAG TPA_asm: hypothetical protein [Caudoviricetes sp.]
MKICKEVFRSLNEIIERTFVYYVRKRKRDRKTFMLREIAIADYISGYFGLNIESMQNRRKEIQLKRFEMKYFLKRQFLFMQDWVKSRIGLRYNQLGYICS